MDNETIMSAVGWLRMAASTLHPDSEHKLCHTDKLEAALKALKEWQQAENATADANAKRGE